MAVRFERTGEPMHQRELPDARIPDRRSNFGKLLREAEDELVSIMRRKAITVKEKK